MCWELRHRGSRCGSESVLVPLIYKGIRVDVGYRTDIIVNERVLVELKSVERLAEFTPRKS